MKCPKCGKEHTGKFKHCQHCLDKMKIAWQKYQKKRGINKPPTKCVLCGKIIEQSRMGRPKIYCTECAFKQYRNWKKRR